MYEQIVKNKPKGATHWRCGVYFKMINPTEWYYFENGEWKFTSHIDKFILEMTSLN